MQVQKVFRSSCARTGLATRTTEKTSFSAREVHEMKSMMHDGIELIGFKPLREL
jgi:hypothetical protein